MATASVTPSPPLSRAGGGRLKNVTGRTSLVLNKHNVGARNKLLREASHESSTLTTPMEHSLRILTPAQKKLTSVEAQRVMAVVIEASRKLEGALSLPFLAQTLDRFSVSLDSEAVELLQLYRQLCGEYSRLYEEMVSYGIHPDLSVITSRLQSSSSDVAGGESRVYSQSSIKSGSAKLEPLAEQDVPEEGLEERFRELQFRLRHTCKSLLRVLGATPVSDTILTAAATERPANASSLLEAMSELQEIMREKLLTTHDEETKRREYVREVMEKEKTALADIANLETELEEARRAMEGEVNSRSKKIKDIMASIRLVDRQARESERRMQEEANKQIEQELQRHSGVESKLGEEISTLQKTLQETVAANRAEEQNLRKKAFKRETEVDNWIQKYDHDLGELQDELEQLEIEHAEEKQQLKELDERLGVLSIEYDVVVKEQEEARQRAKEAANNLRNMVWAATTIQSFWRSYLTRKQLRGDTGKKKKKGKGKGKGKGKKGAKKR